MNVTTDALFGIGAETYDELYLYNLKDKVKEIVNVDRDADVNMKADAQLKAYYFLKDEADKNPANYSLLQECIDYGAGLSRYTDFNNYMSDRMEERNAIFKNCARKAACIIRYSLDHVLVERAHNAMTWIYAHNKDFEKAKEHANILPSYESNRMRETMLAQIQYFEHGFEAERICILDNIKKLSKVLDKELSYDLEDFAGNAEIREAEEFGNWVLEVAAVFKKNPSLTKQWEDCEERLNKYIQIVKSRK